MNREIKFRVWDNALDKMITKKNVGELLDTVETGNYDTDHTYSQEEWYAYDILTIFDYFEEMQCKCIENSSTKRFELMQYTGLHDKNGEEIYENDIVYVASEDENATIEWDEQTARFIIHFNGWIADFDNYYGKESEVMGDIYNNPELLGGE